MAHPESLEPPPPRAPTGLPAARTEPRRAPDGRPSHTGPLPLGGFRLTIDGTWCGYRPSEPQKKLRLEFAGEWQITWKPKRIHSTKIEGVVLVEGVADEAPMKGTLSVKLPLLGFELAIEFTDSRGQPYRITATSGSVLNAAARHTSVKGALNRSAMQLGDVDLQVDWSLVKDGLPSIT